MATCGSVSEQRRVTCSPFPATATISDKARPASSHDGERRQSRAAAVARLQSILRTSNHYIGAPKAPKPNA
jgi:hypothetical protein